MAMAAGEHTSTYEEKVRLAGGVRRTDPRLPFCLAIWISGPLLRRSGVFPSRADGDFLSAA
eukprot:6793685-Pyramimonas_sp.AAC.1